MFICWLNPEQIVVTKLNTAPREQATFQYNNPGITVGPSTAVKAVMNAVSAEPMMVIMVNVELSRLWLWVKESASDKLARILLSNAP